jgi:hypothetical protein
MMCEEMVVSLSIVVVVRGSWGHESAALIAIYKIRCPKVGKIDIRAGLGS